MTTPASSVTPLKLTNYATAQLASRQAAFVQTPSSFNWEQTLRAMYVYQQVRHVVDRGGLLGAYELCESLAGLDLGEWGDAISVHATGHSVSDALAYTA